MRRLAYIQPERFRALMLVDISVLQCSAWEMWCHGAGMSRRHTRSHPGPSTQVRFEFPAHLEASLSNGHLSWTAATAALVTAVTISKVFKFVSGLKAVDYLPGLWVPFQPLSLLGVLAPEKSWNPGVIFVWTWRHTRNIYRRFGSDTVSIVPFFSGAPSIYTRSMDVTRQVVTAGHKSGAFSKTDDMGRAFLFWGPSLVMAGAQDQWRKHRRIAGPAFNNDTYQLVWNASRKVYADMIDCEGWAEKATIDVPRIQTLTTKFTLLIIATCGFGLPFSWGEPPSHDGQMSIQQCLEIITIRNSFAIIAPKWAWKLPLPWVRQTRQAFDTMRAFMNSHVQARREAINSAGDDTPKDILSLFVRASEEGGKLGLDNEELIGNIFALLFAGHETTSHTLAATLGFLSLNPSIQEEIVEQFYEVTKGRENGEITFEDYSKLDKALAAFYEAIRMFPSGVYLIREAKQDTVLNLSGIGEEPKLLPVAKGTHVVVDMVGVHYNPQYFSDPEEFKPARWYADRSGKKDIADSEDHTGFSVGPRSCLGKRFATTEAVCFLVLLLRDWRVEPLLSVNVSTGEKETKEEWRERVMQAKMTLTMGVRDVPLTFVKRV
ncbi:cytochrome P450 [Suillus clintonianus]|uniref:cytochrome P450 n=1 Tax=Suillus clintonianus TaxID=1904413 RepID=UPI001B86EE43|nr:cytochrome P450 [Suillus clintonianus]KAG2154041.1 cytochrome P450 [Suillus clintonianus]